MRQWLRQTIPSMFLRRLLFLAAVIFLLGSLLLLQMARLCLAQHELWNQRAQNALADRTFIPTIRGRILDAKGRVLAADIGCFDVSVRYPVISGRWAYLQAEKEFRKTHRDNWRSMNSARREQLIAGFLPKYETQVQELWQTLAQISHATPDELEERKNTIRARVEQIAADVWAARLRSEQARLEEDVPLSQVARPIGEQLSPHPLVPDVDDAGRLFIERRLNLWRAARDAGGEGGSPASVWSMVSIARSWKRDYPMQAGTVAVDRSLFPSPLRSPAPAAVPVQGLGIHWIGALRPLWKEDRHLAERPFLRRDADGNEFDLGGYRPGDLIGYFGVERAAQENLQGSRGQILHFLDSDQEKRTEPLSGDDVSLTLDIQLQARIQALMSPPLGLMRRQSWQAHELPPGAQLDDPLCGAAVVMEISTGNVLAAVSVPGFTLEDLRQNPSALWADKINRPFINRCIAQPYEPGSTLKPMVLAAALTDGRLRGAHDTITCYGFMDPGKPNAFRCWIYKQFNHTHGPLAGPEAIARSCNIFFYSLGQRLTAPALIDWYDKFGLGRLTNCGLAEEIKGDLPAFNPVTRRPLRDYSIDEARLMGIGQGPLRWTPLQAANAYAALARGGRWMPPKIWTTPDASRSPAETSIDLGLSSAAIAPALEGMDDAVNKSYGTGHHLTALGGELTFTVKGVHVSGKSGTATAAPLLIDSDGDNRITRNDRIARSGDHAWFIGLVRRAGENQPRLVIAVVVEYAGSGGSAAGPIANQILVALRAEGYL